jgi:hypothetical protein
MTRAFGAHPKPRHGPFLSQSLQKYRVDRRALKSLATELHSDAISTVAEPPSATGGPKKPTHMVVVPFKSVDAQGHTRFQAAKLSRLCPEWVIQRQRPPEIHAAGLVRDTSLSGHGE